MKKHIIHDNKIREEANKTLFEYIETDYNRVCLHSTYLGIA
ncbi:hypothetical protein [Gilliamella sp. Fer1-1]|nr:hypothetical protein [Gilliamella apicola]